MRTAKGTSPPLQRNGSNKCVESSWRFLRLVHTRRSFPIEYVHEFPGILSEVKLQLALLIDNQLSCGIYHPRALVLVSFVQLELAGCQVERLRLAIHKSLAE